MASKKKKKRRVALVGTAPSSAHAPIGDSEWEIWGVGYRGDHITRCDRWYELHRLDGLRDGPEWRPLLKEWGRDCQLVMMWPEPDLGPNVRQYPLDLIKAKYGTYFMTSSFAWMLAEAVEEHEQGAEIDEIGVWGVDMEYGTEYREQRSGLRHFLALARFAGIGTRVLVNGGVIYEPVPYPFWQDDPLLEKLQHRRRGVEADMQVRKRALEAGVARVGALTVTIEELQKAEAAPKRVGTLIKERAALQASLPQMQTDVAYAMGAIEEIDWQLDYLKP